MSVLKRTIFFVLAGILVLAQGLQAEVGKYRQEGLYEEDNPATKLGRGITNVILSPGEYVVQTAKFMGTNDPVTAYGAGFAMGTWKMLERIGGGLYEIVTFPFPFPKKKYRPLMDPPTTAAALQDSEILQTN
ncbi:MAG: exosortase system-associated protein, TIGR04073 family [Candidatus Omnitrophota bacterium]